MTEMNRRQFVAVVAAGAGAAVCACVGGCASGGARDEWAGPTQFDLGAAGQFKPGVDARWATSGGFFVVREAGRLYAVSAICSHKACPLAAKPAEYVCPCHGSRFTPQGKVTVGPATTSLPRFGISPKPDGGVAVDRSKTYEEARWDEAGAFLAI